MNLEVKPYELIGRLHFGDSREVARQVLGGHCIAFPKHRGQPDIDVANDLGLHLHYDDQDKLEFVEAFEPASISLEGISLLGRGFDKIEKDLDSHGYGVIPIDNGYLCEAAGLAFTVTDNQVEGVGVFCKGYYDEY